MSQPTDSLHFDDAQRIIAFPARRIEQHPDSPGSGKQRKEGHPPPKQEDAEEETPQDIIEVSGEYQAVAAKSPALPIPHALPSNRRRDSADPPPTSPAFHLDINT